MPPGNALPSLTIFGGYAIILFALAIYGVWKFTAWYRAGPRKSSRLQRLDRIEE